jgi:hypothetical protein
MADMYGAVRSNIFKVKDIETFKAWFATYHFGYDIELWVDDEAERTVGFGGYEQYPSAHPRVRDSEDDLCEANLHAFAQELCGHLEEGEVFSVSAGGHEKLRYVSFDQLTIAQQHPREPHYQRTSSDDGNDVLVKRVMGVPELVAALQYLLDDLSEVEEDRHSETGVAYASVAYARAALAKAKE